MKRILSVGLLLAVAGLLFAADDKPKPNTLTEKEIAEGWLLLFDGETTFGWQSPNESKWTIASGMLAPQAGKPGVLVTTTPFADYELKIDYIRRFTPGDDGKGGTSVQVRVNCERDGSPKDKTGRYELQPRGDSWASMTILVKDGTIRSVNGGGIGFKTEEKKSDVPDKKPVKQTGFLTLAGNGVVFRNIKVKPLGTEALFNGKDLTGWKKYTGDDKRAKTEFSVSQDGNLQLKNGPGDLQTEKQFADFILQAECRSNGKHLNSGIFFRCIPGQYQNGYEAQIHNGWTEKPEKEVEVEIYDPETNKLKTKEKVKTAAMDYGTGAIYRRIPARKQVAKDNEWFTMTVAAHGRHIATWVNGVQVVDWTDNRPPNENPRNGAKTDKGAISLQGHDPTTDLSFRNIRITELPAK
jgi:hypothetical protein